MKGLEDFFLCFPPFIIYTQSSTLDITHFTVASAGLPAG